MVIADTDMVTAANTAFPNGVAQMTLAFQQMAAVQALFPDVPTFTAFLTIGKLQVQLAEANATIAALQATAQAAVQTANQQQAAQQATINSLNQQLAAAVAAAANVT